MYKHSTRPSKGTKYAFCEGPKDWPSAEAACQSRGGHLATASDLFLNSLLRGLDAKAGDTWIGLADRDMPGQFVWASGQVAPYRNWAPGQPDNAMGKEHCVQLYDGMKSTQWNDLGCGEPRSYLCQLP